LILIVAQDSRFLEVAQALLGRTDRVYFAFDEAQALTIIDYVGTDIGVVVVDLDRRTGSGFELLRSLRSRVPDVPMIAVLASLSEAALEDAKVFGADEALSKPITPDWKTTVDRLRRRTRWTPH
jgi:CheY-like chemotaxis protein